MADGKIGSVLISPTLFNNLTKAKPAVIGIDISFSDLSGNPGDDKALVQAVKNSGKLLLPVKGVFTNAENCGQ